MFSLEFSPDTGAASLSGRDVRTVTFEKRR